MLSLYVHVTVTNIAIMSYVTVSNVIMKSYVTASNIIISMYIGALLYVTNIVGNNDACNCNQCSNM
jgi:hypothetical protein